MKRSVFTRVEYSADGYDLVVGIVERFPADAGDSLERPEPAALRAWVCMAYHAMRANEHEGHYILARELEERVQRQWPGREYFVEVGEDQMAHSTQVYGHPEKVPQSWRL